MFVAILCFVYNQHQVFSGNSVVINSCEFRKCFSNIGGGVYYNSDEGNISIFNSLFFSCFADSSGGVYAKMKRIEMKNVCFQNCSAQSCSSAYLLGKESYVNLTMCNKCPGELRYGHCGILLHEGIQFSTYTNFSKSRMSEVTGLYHWVAVSSIVLYHISVDNNCGRVIGFANDISISFNHKYLNFINNTITHGLINVAAQVTLENSVFKNNSGPMTYRQNPHTQVLNLISCSFDINTISNPGDCLGMTQSCSFGISAITPIPYYTNDVHNCGAITETIITARSFFQQKKIVFLCSSVLFGLHK